MAPRVNYRFLIAASVIVLASSAIAKDPERIPAAGGQTILKEFRDDGSIKTLTRVEADGRLVEGRKGQKGVRAKY